MIVQWTHFETGNGVWAVSFGNIEGQYELSGPLPVQAVDSVQGTEFYFRAKYDAWEFETNDETGGLFSSDDPRAFQRSGASQGASQMSFPTAAKIIAHCVSELINQMN